MKKIIIAWLLVFPFRSVDSKNMEELKASLIYSKARAAILKKDFKLAKKLQGELFDKYPNSNYAHKVVFELKKFHKMEREHLGFDKNSKDSDEIGLVSKRNNFKSYTGETRFGQYHGYGSRTLRNGTKYSGQWYRGLQYGYGQVFYPDGSKYAGQWQEARPSGMGFYKTSDGLVRQGLFYTGEFLCPYDIEPILPALSKVFENLNRRLEQYGRGAESSSKNSHFEFVFDLDISVDYDPEKVSYERTNLLFTSLSDKNEYWPGKITFLNQKILKKHGKNQSQSKYRMVFDINVGKDIKPKCFDLELVGYGLGGNVAEAPYMIIRGRETEPRLVCVDLTAATKVQKFKISANAPVYNYKSSDFSIFRIRREVR
jgi:hypothetical protein